MKLRYALVALLCAGGWSAAPARGAVLFSSLSNPTLQTLINLGSTGVQVGADDFSNFSFLDLSTENAPSASQIHVLGIVAAGSSLEFVSGWNTDDGSTLEDLISFDVQSINAARPIGKISLTSNGTAPVPAKGTYTSASLISELPGGGTAAPVLSNYNDGVTTPDTTKPDVNSVTATFTPQAQLHIIDTLLASSAPAAGGSGGLATISVLQNSFVNVPEPRQFFGMVLLCAVVMSISRRPVSCQG